MGGGRTSDSGTSEHIRMDALAYSSRMLNWAPLGKLILVIDLFNRKVNIFS